MERKNQKIIFVHLFNNFSGSPNVLAGVVRFLRQAGYHVSLLTSFNNAGFLSDVAVDKAIHVSYRFVSNPLLLLLRFLRFQLIAGLKILFLPKGYTVYLNTIQPFFPAFLAKLRGFRVVYHVHEAYPQLTKMNRFLFYVLNHTADHIVCVSAYVRDNSRFLNPVRAEVLYNRLSENFKAEADLTIARNFKKRSTAQHEHLESIRRKVLMISSARPYKGIFAFCDLARKMPEFSFVLVCDATGDTVKKLFESYLSVENLEIHSTQTNLHPFYEMADLIVNFSDPRLIVETFGLTVLEGMYYGLPAIVPPVGGITELVDEGYNGFRVDVQDTELLCSRLREILADDESYHHFTHAAFDKYQQMEEKAEMKVLTQIV